MPACIDCFVSVVTIPRVIFPEPRSLSSVLSHPRFRQQRLLSSARGSCCNLHLSHNHKCCRSSIPSSRIELPLLQSTPMTLLGRRTPARHLHIRRLHVLLRETCANLLVGLCVGLFAVARTIQHTLARDARFERRVVCVRRRLGLGAFCADGCRSLRRCAWACFWSRC
jgi:hypothetical protein